MNIRRNKRRISSDEEYVEDSNIEESKEIED